MEKRVGEKGEKDKKERRGREKVKEKNRKEIGN